LGSHADVGGGFVGGELPKIALGWMVSQATKAGVRMKPYSETISANPVLHDKSDNQYSNTGPDPKIEDREVHFQDGRRTTITKMTGAGMTFLDTQRYINYLPTKKGSLMRTPRPDYVTGTVDMRGYFDWLNDPKNGYVDKPGELGLTLR
jgi:hypothetical protein